MKSKYLTGYNGWLLLVVAVLMAFGVVAVWSASSVLSFQRFGHNNYYFFRQGIFALIAFAVILGVSRIDYRFWRKWAKPLMLVSILILGATLVPAVGTAFGGSRSWIDIGPVTVQPSEFVKLAIIFYLASWFERKKDAENNLLFGVVPPLLVVGLAAGLVVLQPDLGMALMISVITLVMLFVAGVRSSYLTGLVGAGVLGVLALIQAAPYRAARLTSFFDPSVDPLGIGYHINQALLAIGSGGFWGLGLGDSRQKHNYLPEPIADSIFAVMAEELGFFRILFIIMLFAVFAFLGLRIAKKAPDKFSRLTAVGITSWVALQAVINMGAISHIFPLTGLTLPFISYGGSSLLSLAVGIGVLLNISRHRM